MLPIAMQKEISAYRRALRQHGFEVRESGIHDKLLRMTGIKGQKTTVIFCDLQDGIFQTMVQQNDGRYDIRHGIVNDETWVWMRESVLKLA